MAVYRLMRIIDTNDGLKVISRWKSLPNSEETTAKLSYVYKYVPQLLILRFNRKYTPTHLAAKVRTDLYLWKRGMWRDHSDILKLNTERVARCPVVYGLQIKFCHVELKNEAPPKIEAPVLPLH